MPENNTTETTPRYYALNGIGWGRGNTPGEAIENFVANVGRRWKTTVYKSRASFEKELRTGDIKPQVWHAPEGTTGFVLDSILNWTSGDDNDVYTPADYRDQLLDDTVKRELPNPNAVNHRLEDVEVRFGDFDPQMICPKCDEVIADVEHRDSLGLLARTALGHMAEGCKA